MIHCHQTEVTESLRARAEEGVRRAAARLRRAMDATVCFDVDGIHRTVEIVLHAPRYRRLVACGAGRRHEVALSEALERLDAQIQRIRSARKKRLHATELRA